MVSFFQNLQCEFKTLSFGDYSFFDLDNIFILFFLFYFKFKYTFSRFLKSRTLNTNDPRVILEQYIATIEREYFEILLMSIIKKSQFYNWIYSLGADIMSIISYLIFYSIKNENKITMIYFIFKSLANFSKIQRIRTKIIFSIFQN